jgi:hypothetical protein
MEDATVLDEGETPPSPEIIRQATALIREVSAAMLTPLMVGAVSTFWGELNITWRVATEIVRVAWFPKRPAILQYGDLTKPLGSYVSETDPTPESVAKRLDAMSMSDGTDTLNPSNG